MSDNETDNLSNNSLEVIEKPKKKISQRQREAGIENLKKGGKSRETKILNNNNNYNINPYLEFEKILNHNNEVKQEKPKEETKKENNNDLKYMKELERKIDMIANINLETNKKVNKIYEVKKAKAQAKIEQAVNNNTQKNNNNNDLYSRLAHKLEQKIKNKI
jgi:hypothetical protein